MSNNPQPDYQWHETSPGRFERDLDEVEQIYATLAKFYEGTGHSFFAITGYLEISLQLSSSEEALDVERRVDCAFQNAWFRLRNNHPTIASHVEYDSSTKRCRKIYQSLEADTQARSKWLESTFKIVSSSQPGVEFANSSSPVQPHATLYFIKPPAETGSLRRSIVFRCPHMTIDGIGTLMLLDNLMAHAAEAFETQEPYSTVNISHEHERLSPTLRIAAAIPSIPDPAHLQRFAESRAAESTVRKSGELLYIPYDRETTIPRASRRIAIHLNKDEAQRLIVECKAHNLSVTHAFHAGIVLAMYKTIERKDEERKVRYVNYSLVNLRPLCPPPYNSARYAASTYHTIPSKWLAIDLVVPAKQSPQDSTDSPSFASVTSQIKKYYLDVKQDPDLVPMTPLLFGSITPPYPEEQLCKVPPPNSSPSVSISSMGVIEKLIQSSRSPFTIDAPWVTGDEYGTGVGTFLGSWRGEMTLSAVFNTAFHEEDNIVKFLSDVKEVVFAGLGVK